MKTMIWLLVVCGLALLSTGCADEEASTAVDAVELTENASAETASAPTVSRVQVGVPAEGNGFDPVAEYDDDCPDDREDADYDEALECAWLRGLIVTDVVDAMEQLYEARDQRGVEEALAALAIDDEPELLIAACRVLGQFPESPGIADALMPLLLNSPYLAVQRIAAEVLARNPDIHVAAMANLWKNNHQNLASEDPYSPMPDLPAHYAQMAFPELPGAEWFSPADSDRSAGWSSADSVDQVTDWLRDELDVEALDYQAWSEYAQAAMSMPVIDQGKLDEIQRLTEAFLASQDEKLLEQIERLQQEISQPMDQAAAGMGMAMTDVLLPAATADLDQARFLIAEERDGRASRVILVYRQPLPARTVIQMAWDLRDYPAAW